MTTKQYPSYWKDERSKNEIQITNKLAQKLSEINHSRNKPLVQFISQNLLFVLIGGVPSIPNEFIGLKFPGKVVRYFPPFFDRSKQEEKQPQNVVEEKLFNVSMDNTSDEISHLIESNGFTEAIIVYHSFGGSIGAWFCSKHPIKVKGLICLGGTPIQFYPIIKDYAKAYLSVPDMGRQFVIENYELVYSLYDEKTKNHAQWTRFKNKEELLSFTLHNDPNTLNNLFDKIRALPLPILMVYGSNDAVLTRPLCSQAMVYMCYLHKSSKQNNPKLQQMKKRFNSISRLYEKTNFNLQEKFVYYIDGGHAIHVSQKNNRIIQNLIDEYLYVILGGQLKSSSKSQNGQKSSEIKPKL